MCKALNLLCFIFQTERNIFNNEIEKETRHGNVKEGK